MEAGDSVQRPLTLQEAKQKRKDEGMTSGSRDFLKSIRETALLAVRRAGEIQMTRFRQRETTAAESLHDIKLETDRLCEEHVLQTIRSGFPDHAIMTEEDGYFEGPGDCVWIVDPLDGTVNFWHGLPFFGVSVACYRKPDLNASSFPWPGRGQRLGEPLVGIVWLPYTQELFVGVTGKGATLNGAPIEAAKANRTSDVVVNLSFGKTPEVMQRMTEKLTRLLPMVRKVRCLGATAAELAYIAAGYLGGIAQEGVKLWDFAAGRILVEEAGGVVEASETGPQSWSLFAASPGVGESLRSIIREVRSSSPGSTQAAC